MAAKFFMNGGVDSNWSSDSNWSTTASSGPNNTTHATSADSVTLDSGSPNCVIDTTCACTSFVCTGYTHTLSGTGSLSTTSTVTLVSGMTLSGSWDMIFAGSAIVTQSSGGKTLPGGLQLNGTAIYTLSGTWTVTGALTVAGGSTINTGALSVAGGITMNGTLLGTSSVTMTGGTWSGAASARLQTPLTFAGNVTVSGSVYARGNTITYSSGTITTTGSTLFCEGLFNVTFNTSGMTWNNVSVTNATYTLSSDLICSGTLTIASTASTTFSGAHNISTGDCTIGGTAVVTVTLSGNLTASGNLLLSSTTSTTFSGSFAIQAATCTIQNTQTVTLAHDLTITGTTTIADANVIAGSFNWNTAGLTTTGALSGAATIVFNGTGTWSGASSLSNSATINTAGTLTLSGTVLYSGGTLTYTGGTVSASGATLSVSSGTLDTSGVTWPAVKLTGTAVTLASNLNVSGALTFPDSALTFSGAHNITIGSFVNVAPTAARTYTFVHGTTITINTDFSTTGTTGSNTLAMKTDSTGNTAAFVLGGSATQNVRFVLATDLDASTGLTVTTYGGSVTNSTNWVATAGIGDVTIPNPTMSGTGNVIDAIGSGGVTIPVPTIDGTGDAFLVVPTRITQHSATIVRWPPTAPRLTQHSLTVVRIGRSEVTFDNDRVPGITHIEVTLSDGTVEVWSVIPMDDPLTYDHGRKAPRVLAWQDIRRTVSDFYGQLVSADFKFTVRDKDLHFLGYLGNPKNVFTNRYTVTKSISDPDRRLQLKRRTIFRGPIRTVTPRAGAVHEFTIQDYLQERFSVNSDVASLPRRRVPKADFPNCAVTKVNSSAEGYVSSGGHSIGDTDITVRGGVGTFSNDQIAFSGHATVYSISASSVTDPETQITVSPALTAAVADGEVITQSPSHQVSPALGFVVPVRAGIITDFKVIDGEDNGDGQGKPLYVGDEVMPDGHTYGIWVWACHGCYSPAGRPIQMIYFWNGALLSSGVVSYNGVLHTIGDLDTEAGSGGRVLLPGYDNWEDNGFDESFVDRNGRRYTIYGLRGILRDMALGVRGAPDNLGGEPHTINARGFDSSLNGHGSEVRDIHDQFVLAFDNFFWGDYQSGPPLPHPTFPDDPTLTLFDFDSIDGAKTHAATLVDGGFVGDWSIGVDNELITMSTFMQWFVRCMGAEQGWNRKTQLMIDRQIFDKDAAMIDAPTLTDERDIQKMSYVIDEAPDENFTAIPFVHTKDEVGRADGGWRSSTADFNVLSSVDEFADDPGTILKFNPTGAKAYSQPLELRLLRGKNTAHDADEAQQGSDTINAILTYKLDMAKVRYFTLVTWGIGFDIEMFDRIWIQHIAGIGGRTPRAARVIEHDAQPDRWRVTLRCLDLEPIFGGAASTVRGTANVTIGNPTIDATGIAVTTGDDAPGVGDITIPNPEIDAAGDAGPNVGAAFQTPAVSATIGVLIPGSGSVSFDAPPAIAGKDTPDDSAIAIGAPSVSGTGTEKFTASGGVAIGNPTIQGQNSGGVLIATTDVAQTVINAHPAGTAFTVQAGIHRDNISPRTGDKYTGEFGAVFSGAIVLTSPLGTGPWHYINQHQQLPYDTAGGAAYRDGFDASGHPENVYYDDQMLQMVSSIGAGGPGKAFFDYPNATIYIWDNPSGHTVECSVLQTAVAAANVGASYSGIIFEKYASLTQGASVTLGGGNVMTNCEVRLCHYAGVETGPGAQFIGGYVHHNGVFGFVGSGSNALIQGVEIAFNNTVNVNGQPFWGAGGAKWVQSSGLVVQGCTSHDNDGPGLWTDINNINVTYDGNTCYNNTFCGIFQEIGYDAIIKNNVCSNNGSTIASLYGKWPQAANICFCDSRNVQIFNNTCNDGYWGISFLQDDRGAGANPDQTHGLWQVTGFTGHNNIINNPLYAMVGGFGPDGDSSWYTSRGNSWSSNTFNNSHGATYEWGGSSDLAGFHAKGQS